jgi:hypothetical protein
MILALKETLPLFSFHFPKLPKSAITKTHTATIADAITMDLVSLFIIIIRAVF